MSNKATGLWQEFKEFISRGSVLDLAVGMVIGAAFTAIVTSLVNDVVMPILSIIIGGLNFSDLKLVITPATATTAEVAITYGNFINAVINFLAISLVIFLMVKAINTFKERIHKQQLDEAAYQAAEEGPTDEVKLLTEIRDALLDRE